MRKHRTSPMNNRSQSFSKTSPIEISKSPPSKNLAHVPCKFFKQGACQAGNSCPFSHVLDTATDTAACKYFQKGNCKFGVKCALAHILPDGRRVNPKTLAQVYQNHSVVNGKSSSNNGSNGYSNGNGYLSSSAGYNATTSPSGSFNAQNTVVSPTSSLNGFSHHNNAGNIVTTSPTFQSSPFNMNSGNSSFQSQTFPYEATVSQQRERATSSNERSSFSLSTNSIWSAPSNITSSTVPDGRTPFYQRSVSHSSTFKQFASSSTPQRSANINESAIVDDDEEEEEDDMLEEDFVPSSLSDLLTPQELQRRGSRPSSSRPNGNFVQFLGKNNGYQAYSNGYQIDTSHHSSTEAIIDPVDENEMQFRMDDEEFYNDLVRNVGANAISTGIKGLTL